MCPPDPPSTIIPPEPQEPEASAELELKPDSATRTRRRRGSLASSAIITTPLSLPALSASGGSATGAPTI